MIGSRSDRNVQIPGRPIATLFRCLLNAFCVGICLAAAGTMDACCAEQRDTETLRVAVYDVPPYGYVEADGSMAGVSVDLWRRVAEQMEWPFKLIPVSDMETILGGLEHGRFDAAIGAITITPERAARVDFSYPAHRSGVAVAIRKETGPIFAIMSYGTALAELSPLIIIILTMLVLIGLAMWFIERHVHAVEKTSESTVSTLRDGLYWAVVTMTTVGYGDKTPKTTGGRVVAIAWMLSSLVLVSLLSTSLVSRLTADRVESRDGAASIDLRAKKLAAVARSSGAEYLDELHLSYTSYKDLPAALDSLVNGQSGAVVNSVGALQYSVSKRYARALEIPQGLLAPAYMAIALPEHSPLKKPIDRALDQNYQQRRMEVAGRPVLCPVTDSRMRRGPNKRLRWTKSPKENPYPAVVSPFGRITCGHNPLLVARVVKDLRRNGNTLKWTEPPPESELRQKLKDAGLLR